MKTICTNIILLIVILTVSNRVYGTWFAQADIDKHSSIVELVEVLPDTIDILYIGESSNNTVDPADTDRRAISQMIKHQFPDNVVTNITKPAAHAGVYKILLENIPEETQLETIVVTCNLRSFNAQWIYSDLETPLQKSLILLKDYPPLLNRFLLSFKGYDIKSDAERVEQFKQKWREDAFQNLEDLPFKNVEEWDKWMARKGVLDESGNYDNPETQLACHFIKGYAFQIDTSSHCRIADFNDIVQWAKERGVRVVFNILAENTEKAEELVGVHLTDMMRRNVDILTEYYSKRGVTIVDNLNQVENEQFIDKEWTTEHYAQKGRKTIADNISTILEEWYSRKRDN